MPIYVGPGGAPISSKDRSTIAGIEECAKLGLNAMEVEFVRGVKMSPALAEETGKLAAEKGVRLSVHAPYYINLLSVKAQIVKASIQRIVDSLDRGERMGADAVAVHAAYLGELSSEQATEAMKEKTSQILSVLEKKGISKIKLGYETMAKKGQWGSLEEIVEIHKQHKKRVVPYLDWGHLYCRGGGSVDYEGILKTMKSLKLDHINSHFNCVKFSDASKAYVDVHAPVATKHPDFAPLAKLLARSRADITLICETPLLEEDALRLKEQLEKAGYKF
jgi:deoxyribonuclease-4